jgi:hypothetical protein
VHDGKTVRKSGLLFLEGSLPPPPPPLSAKEHDVILDHTLTVTWIAGTNEIRQSDPTFDMLGKLKGEEMVLLCTRDDNTGKYTVVARGKVESRKVTKQQRRDKQFPSLTLSTFPKNESGADMSGLRLLREQVATFTPRVPAASSKINRTARDKLLYHGLGSFDISALFEFLTDRSHNLLAGCENVVAYVDHRYEGPLADVKNDRNNVYGHCGTVKKAEYTTACVHIMKLVQACVDVSRLAPEWVEKVEEHIRAENRAIFTVKDQIYFGFDRQGRIENNKFKLKQLIGEQVTFFKKVIEAIHCSALPLGPQQLLIQAASGSGKTLLCAKLAVDCVVRRVQKRVRAE